METFINKIKKLGESISLKNTKSLVFLDNPQYVWMVASGRLNLFAVATENGSPRGARMPLFTVEEGSIVFPPGSTTGKTGITTLATGDPSTDLISIKLPQFVDIAGKGPFSGTACRILDKWIGDVLSYMSHELPPDDCTGVEPGADIRVEANKTFKSSGGILWCEIYEGLAALPGDETAIKLKKGVIFPVSDNTWLRACDNLKIKVISTGDFIKTPAFTGSLFSFNKIFLNYMILKRDRDIKADRERLQKRKAHDEELTKKALYEIASPLLPKSRQYLFEETDDHLLSACKLIGKQTGITFSRPVETEHKRGAGESIIEDMDSIARASRIKKRKVMLRDDWWRKDNGPLLAFKRGEADHPLALIQLSPTEYAVFDPVYKTRQKVNRKIAQSIEPGAYTFFCPLPERKLSFWDLLKYSLKGSGQSIATIFLMGLLAALLGLVVPIATGIIFNTVIPNAEIGLLWQLTLILTACAIGTVAFEITQSVAVLRLQGKTESSLQAAVWDRLMSLRASFFRNYTSGDQGLCTR